MKTFSNFKIILLGLALITLSACSKNPVTGKKQLSFMSEKQEVAMGQQADPEILSMFGLYNDDALQAFVDKKGQEMAVVSHRPQLKYHFRIVDSPILNAFAVPGGYVYFTRGIMAHFNNEAEFAGVLGHEIGHITARHSVIQQRNQILAQIGLMAGIIALPELANFLEPASAGLGLLLLKFGRDAERQSDKLGVEYSSKIGYDAKYMGQFFNTIERVSSQGGAQPIPDFLSTHPNPGDRYNTVKQLAADWQTNNNATDLKVNRAEYLRRIEGLVYGEDPRQGFVENNTFFHPELKFQWTIPAGWNHQNSPSQFQVAPKDGKALMVLSIAQEQTTELAAQNFLQKHKLTAVDQRNNLTNGMSTTILIADQIQEKSHIRTLSYFIRYGDLTYHLLSLANADQFASLHPTFTNSLSSFNRLTDQEKINRIPERVTIREVGAKSTLLDFFNREKVPAKRHEELAILNGMKLEDQLQKGDLIKLVKK